MQIELDHALVECRGDRNQVSDAVMEALLSNGAAATASGSLPDVLIVSLPLLLSAGVDVAPLVKTVEVAGEAMFARGSGRIVFLISAVAGMPMRRHPEFSVQMAGVLATVRTMAMRLGPSVLVNAVGVGTVGEPLLAGDPAMVGHASLKRAGTLAEVTDTVLFFADPMNTYTTGQMLSVDGGWSAGYGRNF